MSLTKIVATIGPASRDRAVLRGLIEAGLDVVRVNFSHGTHAEHAEVIGRVREVADELGAPVAVLQDLAGPKLRIGRIEGGSVHLKRDQEFVLTNRAVAGNDSEVGITYPDLPSELEPGDPVLLADGTLELEVVETDAEDIRCRVIVGGDLSSHKGINLPTRSLAARSMTDKDREDLRFGVEQEVDYIALSFVRSAADVEEARDLLESLGSDIPIIAKIEKHEALERIDEILEVADGLMIARGDLGVEIPIEQVPLAQKDLIRRANRAGKPVITATQMLRSMVENPRPTRAEVTDVANAILDGTDAIMLSEETAVGQRPVETVRMMVRIAEDAEKEAPYDVWHGRVTPEKTVGVPEAVAHAACALAEDVAAEAIVTLTHSGSTARQVAKYRPDRMIIAPTPRESTYRRLALVWGVDPVLKPEVVGEEEAAVASAISGYAERKVLNSGDRVVVTAGVPMGTPGGTNLIRVVVLEQA